MYEKEYCISDASSKTEKHWSKSAVRCLHSFARNIFGRSIFMIILVRYFALGRMVMGSC